MRRLAIAKSLRVLEAIQPSSGGFLEATPLTSFVTLGLASIGRAEHPVVRKAVEFWSKSVRPDGSWPIDTNLSTWVTTLSINALAAAGELDKLDNAIRIARLAARAAVQGAASLHRGRPGRLGLDALPGGVPDADDTPGALLALYNLVRCRDGRLPIDPRAAMASGLRWLLAFQNRDGGWPTFCRGWGALPFDRSGCDLTAHVAAGCCRLMAGGSCGPACDR